MVVSLILVRFGGAGFISWHSSIMYMQTAKDANRRSQNRSMPWKTNKGLGRATSSGWSRSVFCGYKTLISIFQTGYSTLCVPFVERKKGKNEPYFCQSFLNWPSRHSQSEEHYHLSTAFVLLCNFFQVTQHNSPSMKRKVFLSDIFLLFSQWELLLHARNYLKIFLKGRKLRLKIYPSALVSKCDNLLLPPSQNIVPD